MTTQDMTLSVVESDEPKHVRMFNSLGCEIGHWAYDVWVAAMKRDYIVIQIGDKFVMEE